MPLFFAMKHKFLKAFFAILGFAIVGWLSFMQPDWLLLSGALLGVCGYSLFVLVFTPIGNLTLGHGVEKLPLGKWFAKLLLGQLSLLIFTIAAAVAFFAAGPGYSLSTVTLTDFQQLILHYSRWEWGPFPWSAAGIWGLVIAYVTYFQKGEPYLYQGGRHFLGKRIEPMLKSYIESVTSGATLLLLALLVSAIILLFTYVVDFYFNVFHFVMPIMTVILLSFLGPFASLSMGRKALRWLSGGRFATLNRIMLLFVVLIVPIMITSAFVGMHMLESRPELKTSMICKECGNYFANVPMQARLGALYWGWWLLWTPLAGSYLAKISKGRTVREFILGLYAVPVVVACVWAYLHYYPVSVGEISLAPGWLSWGFGLLGLIALMALLITFKATKDTHLLLSGFMTPKNNAHANRLWLKDPSKATSINRLSPKLLMTIIGTLFLHSTAGWFGVQLQTAAMGALVVNALYMGFNFGLYQWYRDRKVPIVVTTPNS